MKGPPLRILLAHNYYQIPGGEDEVFCRERDLLVAAGHQVVEYVRHNREIADYSSWQRASLLWRTTWAQDSYRDISRLLQQHAPDVAHFHNTFPLISPAAYYACANAGVPVVQSVHNPRLFCPAATCYRSSAVCVDCLTKRSVWPGVLHACYRESRVQTGVVAAMLGIHRWINTWERLVDCYIVFTDFYRQKLIEAGIPSERIAKKTHFVEDPGPRRRSSNYGLFVGRLAREKGLATLLEAWKALAHIPLKIRGEGPMEGAVREASRNSPIELLPRLSRPELTEVLGRARFLLWPSEGYYETFGCVAAEAFACGVPVIGSRIGAMEEMVADGRTGLTFRAGDSNHLATQVDWAWSHPQEIVAMGRAARKEYEQKYTPERGYRMLLDIYESVVGNSRCARSGRIVVLQEKEAR